MNLYYNLLVPFTVTIFIMFFGSVVITFGNIGNIVLQISVLEILIGLLASYEIIKKIQKEKFPTPLRETHRK